MIWAQLGVGGGGSCEPGKHMYYRYAPLVGVELADGVEGAALLAEALRDAAQHDHRGRGVLQAHLVAPVIVLRDMTTRSEDVYRIVEVRRRGRGPAWQGIA